MGLVSVVVDCVLIYWLLCQCLYLTDCAYRQHQVYIQGNKLS